ncbi:hypothetical protein DFP72DRAFT_843282 [Ephemerocybe angulata]|uniref:Uncharacterized protein n=1 Tax=Ephemerocybe angulata TaxID=980116 RepID=A0A8H6IAN5_9AGAR|nr:hypothetical protein DFP72DRAFT_843282 [Tulosesus angulatus]
MLTTRSKGKAKKKAVLRIIPNKDDAKVPHPQVKNLNGPVDPSYSHHPPESQLTESIKKGATQAYQCLMGGKVLRNKGDYLDMKNAPYYLGAKERDHDSLTHAQVRDYHIVLQELSARMDPITDDCNMRHPEDAYMFYPALRDRIDPNDVLVGMSMQSSSTVKGSYGLAITGGFWLKWGRFSKWVRKWRMECGREKAACKNVFAPPEVPEDTQQAEPSRQQDEPPHHAKKNKIYHYRLTEDSNDKNQQWYPFGRESKFRLADFLYRDEEMTRDPTEPSWKNTLFSVWYCDPSVVVRNLLDNPNFDGQFNYAPYVELDKNRKRHWSDFMETQHKWPSIILYYSFSDNLNVYNTIRHAHQNAVILIGFMAIPKELAAFIANYLEQGLLGGTVQGWCLQCTAISTNLGTSSALPQSCSYMTNLMEKLEGLMLRNAYGIDNDIKVCIKCLVIVCELVIADAGIFLDPEFDPWKAPVSDLKVEVVLLSHGSQLIMAPGLLHTDMIMTVHKIFLDYRQRRV